MSLTATRSSGFSEGTLVVVSICKLALMLPPLLNEVGYGPDGIR